MYWDNPLQEFTFLSMAFLFVLTGSSKCTCHTTRLIFSALRTFFGGFQMSWQAFNSKFMPSQLYCHKYTLMTKSNLFPTIDVSPLLNIAVTSSIFFSLTPHSIQLYSIVNLRFVALFPIWPESTRVNSINHRTLWPYHTEKVDEGWWNYGQCQSNNKEKYYQTGDKMRVEGKRMRRWIWRGTLYSADLSVRIPGRQTWDREWGGGRSGDLIGPTEKI